MRYDSKTPSVSFADSSLGEGAKARMDVEISEY